MRNYVPVVLLPVFMSFALSLVAPCGASAMTARSTLNTPLIEKAGRPLTLSLGTGLLNGKSRELVYKTGGSPKISELIWRLDDVPVVGLSASVKLKGNASLNLSAWSKVGDPTSHMEDYDWFQDIHPTDWTHYSKSPTTLKRGEMYDANLMIPIVIEKGVSLSGMLGFRHDHWHWEDKGGYYIYSETGFRKDRGTFEDKTGITYEQWFYAPYIGIQVDYRYRRFLLNCRLAGGPWAWAEDEDHHLNGDRVYEDEFDQITYFTSGVRASWFFTNRWALSVDVDYQKYNRRKGSAEVTTPTMHVYNRKGAGIDHYSWMTDISIEYRF